MHRTHGECNNAAVEKGQIVCLADAVVEPIAVVIEFFSAPVAATTMFRRFLDRCLADVTLVLILRNIEKLPKHL